MANTIELAQTGKRDYLISLEKKYQARWREERLFETNAPSKEELHGLSAAEIREKYPKWFGNFAYPYMNGSLHLGHAFSISKIEFAAGYQRLLGKRVLFPHGMHATGMPIKAAADKVQRELAMFGENFERYDEIAAEDKPKTTDNGSAAPGTAVGKATKGKVAAKATGLTYQFQIMESMVKKFADPHYWLYYFPPICIVYWRRSFLTTDINPYYDSFVRWQMNKLYQLGKIKFGERYTIYSPKDGQPCMDHDRSDGEGVGPQEYLALRMEVVEWSPAAKEAIEGKVDGRKVYGQTNCFVGPNIKYGVFAVERHRSLSRNMAFQGVFPVRGEIPQLVEIAGSILVGTRIKAPLGVMPEVYVLPMENVKDTKGTGVVTFHLTAVAVCKELKIQSQKDIKQLAEAKEIAYKEGFYNWFHAKPKVRAQLIQMGLAFPYAEPESLVISRSADECVVALMDQWYLDYGEPTWRAQAEKLLAKMNTWGPETRNLFEVTLAWLNKWACARTYGLGSKMPWDPQFLVESLSDSTIYMAYYTVSHLLHCGDVTGHTIGPLGEPFPKEKADALKHEYNYFYPFDMRSSGKDLVQNNLTFLLYNHVAIFPEDKWPLGIRMNGHLMINGQKMSKSKGNSLTLRDGIEKFGADAMRLTLADAGDGVEDANFDEKTANANILRLHTLLGWCEEMLKDDSKLRHGAKSSYHDHVFEEEIIDLINITKTHYEATSFKDALKYCFYEFQNIRDWYREVTSDIGMHADLVKYWIRVSVLLVTPFAPHFAEHIWTEFLREPKSIQLALWPDPGRPADRAVIEAGIYMRSTLKTIRDAETTLLKKMQKGKKGKADGPLFDPKLPKSVRIYVASQFPEWQDACVQAIKDSYSAETDKVDDVKVRTILTENGMIKDKRAMPFVQAFKKRMSEIGATNAFRRTLPFSESQILTEFLPYLKKSLNLVDVEVLSVEQALQRQGPGFTPIIIESSEPGSPAFEYHNV
ncbi:hypothetical protein F5141DRAFT_1133125 [Pisolithus sp. B1]|nr:hypothetical protein F5141DRAFT_1133125 [Pisolithus sp. B1]